MGLVGLLIFLLANLKFTRDMFRLLQGSTGDIRSSLYSLIGLIAIVCYLIISMTCNTFNWYAIFSQYAFAFMALAYKLPEIRKETGSDPNRPR
jgi:Ca2+/Na+ antiporter